MGICAGETIRREMSDHLLKNIQIDWDFLPYFNNIANLLLGVSHKLGNSFWGPQKHIFVAVPVLLPFFAKTHNFRQLSRHFVFCFVTFSGGELMQSK